MYLRSSKNKFKTIFASASMACMVSLSALGFTTISTQAATLTVIAGQLTGATNVDLGGLGFFDVEFIDSSCADLFSGCDAAPDFDFNQANSQFAAQALFDQVFLDTPGGSFDSDPTLTIGCSFASGCLVFIPYGINGLNSISITTATNAANDIGDGVGAAIIGPNIDLSSSGNQVYARFSAVSAVPVPAALPLFGTGLAIMGFMGWRRKRKAA